MENPRPEKTAVVDEVREKFSSADAAILTEYRGIDVRGMQQLRRALIEAGGDYKVYKNTLVRLAVADLDLDIADLLLGPTAIAFVPPGDDAPGDVVPVAKALRDFARTNEHLVVKGGLLGEARLSADEARSLAAVAPRVELLSRFAGGLAAPMQQLAGLLQALPRELAGLLQALIDDKGGVPEASEPEVEAEPEAAAHPEEEAAKDESADTGDDDDAGEPTENGNAEEQDESAENVSEEEGEPESAENVSEEDQADSPAEAADDESGNSGNDDKADSPAEAADDESGNSGNDDNQGEKG